MLQLPLRHPIELAHRVHSVQILSGNRLRLGVGSGSTRADFELLGYDYDHRFGIMKRSLETMRRAWRGEGVNAGGVLSVWPGCEGGPPILMGAWRSPRWITFAAQECQGGRPLAASAVGTTWSMGCRSIAKPAVPTPCWPTSPSISQAGRNPPAPGGGHDLVGCLARRGAPAVEADGAIGLRRGPAGVAFQRAGGYRAGARLSRSARGSATRRTAAPLRPRRAADRGLWTSAARRAYRRPATRPAASVETADGPRCGSPPARPARRWRTPFMRSNASPCVRISRSTHAECQASSRSKVRQTPRCRVAPGGVAQTLALFVAWRNASASSQAPCQAPSTGSDKPARSTTEGSTTPCRAAMIGVPGFNCRSRMRSSRRVCAGRPWSARSGPPPRPVAPPCPAHPAPRHH